MPFLVRDNAKIFYDFTSAPNSSGAKTVTLINGHTRSSSDFKIMTRQLHAANMSCLMLDNRAAGQSEANAPFSLKDMQDDVVALWDELHIKSSALLGISMGGFIAQGIAARYPKRVDKLMLVSTAANAKWIHHENDQWIDEEDKIAIKLATYFAPGFIERNKLLFEAMVRQIKTSIKDGPFNERSIMQRDALNADSDMSKYGIIQSKCLVVHGDADRVVSVEAAKELGKILPNSLVKILPGVGHLILAESPKLLYEEAVAFFNK